MRQIEVTEGYCDLRTRDGCVTLSGIPLALVEETTSGWAAAGMDLQITRQYTRKALLESDCLHSVQMQSADGKVTLDDIGVHDIASVSAEYEKKGMPLNITQWHTLADVAKRKKEAD